MLSFFVSLFWFSFVSIVSSIFVFQELGTNSVLTLIYNQIYFYFTRLLKNKYVAKMRSLIYEYNLLQIYA
jgi:UPF0716 family protein affecting phage T7 exclusion